MGTLKPLKLDIVSDVVCPWCYIGKRRIENALALVPDVPVEVRWRRGPSTSPNGAAIYWSGCTASARRPPIPSSSSSIRS